MSSEHRGTPNHFARRSRLYVRLSILLFLLRVVLMLARYGDLPAAPVIGDEVIINEPAIALSRGQGLIAPSFRDSAFGIDKLYSHFPPIYIYTESLAFRAFGVSAASLRLTTTVMDIASTAMFLVLLFYLCRWRLVGWGAAMIAAPLYTLDASEIVLHRIGRMESMLQFFLLTGLFFVIRGIYGIGSDHSATDTSPTHPAPNTSTRRLRSLIAGSVLTGASMAVHPEALTAILPAALLILLAAPLSWLKRVLLLVAMGATPALLWVITYGSKSAHAVVSMGRILRYATEPRPGIFSFAADFFRLTHRNSSQALRATLFFLCLFLLEVLILRWALLESSWWGRRDELRPDAARRLRLTEIFALAALLTIILLGWFVSASITRYDVIFPIYLIAMVISLRGLPSSGRFVLGVSLFVATITVLQTLAAAYYLERGSREAVSATRFDRIVDSIPANMRVAVTPMLWLAFEHKNRPVTLLYKGFDGRPLWQARAANPLDQFDAVIIDSSFQTEYETYTPFAVQGRTKKVFNIGGDEVDLYLPAR